MKSEGRIIKFRIWSNENKKFIEDSFTSEAFPKFILDKEFSLNYNYVWDKNPPKNCIFQQYTGIKDIDDKEIYEGDIVECVYIPNHQKYKGTIVWLYTAWAIHINEIDINLMSCDNLKIVGNIFEENK